MRSVLDIGMAILTVETEFTNMQSVRVLNRLFGCVSNISVLGREKVPNKYDGKHAPRH